MVDEPVVPALDDEAFDEVTVRQGPRRVSRASMILGIAPLVGLLVFLGVWQLVVEIFSIEAYKLPAPWRILRHIASDPGFYARHSRTTLWEAFVGFMLAMLLAVPLATAMALSRFIDRAETMSPEKFKAIEGAPKRAGEIFRRLHVSEAVFPFRFELFAMIDDYLKLLSTKDVTLPAGYHDVVREADRIRSALAAHALPLVACHCDPLCENFLDKGDRMWLVDWEYSGMNDPMWDLGDLSVEAKFDENQDEEMIRAYFGGEPRPAERGRIVIYKAMCDLLWTLWGLIQLANDNPADDFRAYADGRFGRCKALMETSDFARHVAAVRLG